MQNQYDAELGRTSNKLGPSAIVCSTKTNHASEKCEDNTKQTLNMSRGCCVTRWLRCIGELAAAFAKIIVRTKRTTLAASVEKTIHL